MNRQYVESSNLRSIGYDASSSTLEVEFNSGAVWQYLDVPENLWLEFERAESKGRFFHREIKGNYIENQVG